MKSKQEVIQEAWGKYWDQVKDHVNEDGKLSVEKCWEIFGDGVKSNNNFYQKELQDESLNLQRYEYFDAYYPKSIKGIETNNTWLDFAEQREMINGKDYHLGFKHPVTGTYRYLGVYRHDNGFKEEDGHFVRPYPTHIIPIEEPAAPLY